MYLRPERCKSLCLAHSIRCFSYDVKGQMPTEKELDQALETVLRDNGSFREWFVNQTRFKGINATYVLSRSDNPWCTVKVHLPNDQTGELELVKRQGETDVLFVFQAAPGRTLALHIENKLASGRFTPAQLQPEVYRARAELWVRNPKYGNYDEWDTVLVAPSSFLIRHATLAQKFGASISHEEIARWVPSFGSEESPSK